MINTALSAQINLYGVNNTPNISKKLLSKSKVTEFTGKNFRSSYIKPDDFSGIHMNMGIIVSRVPITTTGAVLLFTLADMKAVKAPKSTEAKTTEIKWTQQASSKVKG